MTNNRCPQNTPNNSLRMCWLGIGTPASEGRKYCSSGPAQPGRGRHPGCLHGARASPIASMGWQLAPRSLTRNPHIIKGWSPPFSEKRQGSFSLAQAPGLEFCSCISPPEGASLEQSLVWKYPRDGGCSLLPGALAAVPAGTLATLHRPAAAETIVPPGDTARCCHSGKSPSLPLTQVF